MNADLDSYIRDHIDPEPENLRQLDRRTNLHLLNGRMCSGHLQGRLLSMLVAMIRPHRILELGAFTGYSALCLAVNLPEGGELHTIEIDDEMEPELLELFSTPPARGMITLHIGDALELIPAIPGPWDLVYIDANKRDYTAYLDLVLPLMNPGSFIIADNTLWDGKVADTVTHHDAQTLALDSFNTRVASDPRLESVILPLRDGLTIIRVR